MMSSLGRSIPSPHLLWAGRTAPGTSRCAPAAVPEPGKGKMQGERLLFAAWTQTKAPLMPTGIRGDRSRFHSHFSLKGRYRGQTGQHYPPRSRTHFTSRGLGPLSVGGVPSLSTGGGCYFSVHSAYDLLYYHLKEGVSRRREGLFKNFPDAAGAPEKGHRK